MTSVHDAYGTPEDLRAYQDARQAGELAVRVYCLIGSDRDRPDDRRRGPHRAGRRVGPHRRHEDDLRWLDLRAHMRGCRSPTSAAPTTTASSSRRGRTLRHGPQGTRGRLADRRARQRRRGHRHHAARSSSGCSVSGRGATPASASSTAPSSTTADQPHQGARGDSEPVLDLRLLPRREDALVRRGAARLDVRRAELPRRGHPGDAGVGLPAGPVRADDGPAVERHAHGHAGAMSGARSSG